MTIVPNGQNANMKLDFSSGYKFLFHPLLALRHEATSPQMCTVLGGTRGLLEESPHLETASVLVRFLQFSPFPLRGGLFAYISARDWNQFLENLEFLLLRIMGCIESSGVQFAIPLQTDIAAAFTSNDASDPGLLKVLTSEKKFNDKVTAAKSARAKRSPP